MVVNKCHSINIGGWGGGGGVVANCMPWSFYAPIGTVSKMACLQHHMTGILRLEYLQIMGLLPPCGYAIVCTCS